MGRRPLVGTILFLLIVVIVENVNAFAGYKWVHLKSGDQLPENSIVDPFYPEKYVGRARYYDNMLQAEIYANGTAFIERYNEMKPRNEFDILVALDGCEWTPYQPYNNVLIGVNNGHLNYVNVFKFQGVQEHNERYLGCNIKTNWIETSATTTKLPNNAIFGGKSKENYDMYVARLLRYDRFVSGQFIPRKRIAETTNSFLDTTTSSYFDLLIGEPNEYSWVSASNGNIPDYAVIEEGNFMEKIKYVARFRNNIMSVNKYLRHEYLSDGERYEILVTKPLEKA